jgi:1-acyl-sn-glycerol-3-phosphate acyltransferase
LNLVQFAAIAFFLLLILGPLVGWWLVLRPRRMNLFQAFLWGIAFLLCKLLWRARWLNRLNIDEGRGAIIVCNHRSSVDPFFLQTATGRKIHWMVAREYCEHPALRWFLTACEVIPVSRGGIDTAATKAAIRIASQGGLVGMLPEGRINMTEQFMLPMRPGAAIVALKARVPVIPCYIRGAPYRRYSWSPLLMPARVEIRFGEPVDLSDLVDRQRESRLAQAAMERIARAIAALADQPDFQPQIAGKNWKPTEQELADAMDAAEARRKESGARGQESGDRGQGG